MKNLEPQLLGVLWVNSLELSFHSRIISAAKSHLANVTPLPWAADVNEWLLEVYNDLAIQDQLRTSLRGCSSSRAPRQSAEAITGAASKLGFITIMPLKFCMRVCFPENPNRWTVSKSIGQKENKAGRTVPRMR